jgi:hypothetical protein
MEAFRYFHKFHDFCGIRVSFDVTNPYYKRCEHMKFPLLAVFLLGFLTLQGQEIKVVFSGVTVGNNAARISGAGIYFIQDQVTIATAKSDSKGSFVFSGSIYKKHRLLCFFPNQDTFHNGIILISASWRCQKKRSALR